MNASPAQRQRWQRRGAPCSGLCVRALVNTNTQSWSESTLSAPPPHPPWPPLVTCSQGLVPIMQLAWPEGWKPSRYPDRALTHCVPLWGSRNWWKTSLSHLLCAAWSPGGPKPAELCLTSSFPSTILNELGHPHCTPLLQPGGLCSAPGLSARQPPLADLPRARSPGHGA